jgi:inner membrane protein
VKAKIFSIMLVLLLLVAALVQISGIVQDRQHYREVTVQGVAQSLAGSQALMGPLIHVSCTEEWDLTVDKQVKTERREFRLSAAPSTLAVHGTSELEPRARGLHATQAFALKARLTAQWAELTSLKPTRQHTGSRLSCGQPVLMVAVSDARGIRHASLQLNGQNFSLKPGTFHSHYPRGVHASFAPIADWDAPVSADVQLELVGTGRLSVVPMGGATEVRLTSNWPHPSFEGRFLPADREVGPQGFSASWRVSSLASTAQQDTALGKPVCAAPFLTDAPAADAPPASRGCTDAFGVRFIDPSDTYALSDRATKYGLLFIGLTFVAVGLFEFMKSLRVHPIQYFLVGAAMAMFFLLLVSLSEHMAFGLAYGVAATACVLLLTYYASHMLGHWTRGGPFGLGIAVLYGLLFALLQLEQTALMVGALALFMVLALVMVLTRQVDWYARLRQTPGDAPPAQPAQDAFSRAFPT